MTLNFILKRQLNNAEKLMLKHNNSILKTMQVRRKKLRERKFKRLSKLLKLSAKNKTIVL